MSGDSRSGDGGAGGAGSPERARPGSAAAWEARARAAIGWREGDPLEPVLEALALAAALEVTGALADTAPALRDELRRLGHRAMLQLGAAIGSASDGAAAEREDALRMAAALAKDGLRALAGKPAEGEVAGEPPSPRELARLIAGTAEPLEAAAIARRARASEQARKELAWALRMGRGEQEVTVRLAAADGEAMRDPSAGRHLASIRDGGDLAAGGEEPVVAEVFAFGGGALAVYAASGEPVRLEAPGVRTDAMQAGYWAGHVEEAGATTIQGTLHVGARRFTLSVPVD